MFNSSITRQYKEDKKHWFDVLPIFGLDDEQVYILRSTEKLLRKDIVVPEGVVMDLTGFIVWSHSNHTFQYVTAEEAKNYVLPAR
jgi:hypothetical protein